jgi:hypothetical protein
MLLHITCFDSDINWNTLLPRLRIGQGKIF